METLKNIGHNPLEYAKMPKSREKYNQTLQVENFYKAPIDFQQRAVEAAIGYMDGKF